MPLLFFYSTQLFIIKSQEVTQCKLPTNISHMYEYCVTVLTVRQLYHMSPTGFLCRNLNEFKYSSRVLQTNIAPSIKYSRYTTTTARAIKGRAVFIFNETQCLSKSFHRIMPIFVLAGKKERNTKTDN